MSSAYTCVSYLTQQSLKYFWKNKYKISYDILNSISFLHTPNLIVLQFNPANLITIHTKIRPSQLSEILTLLVPFCMQVFCVRKCILYLRNAKEKHSINQAKANNRYFNRTFIILRMPETFQKPVLTFVSTTLISVRSKSNPAVLFTETSDKNCIYCI